MTRDEAEVRLYVGADPKMLLSAEKRMAWILLLYLLHVLYYCCRSISSAVLPFPDDDLESMD